MTTPRHSLADYLHNIQTRLACCEALQALAQRQHQAVLQQDYPSLLETLALKQQLVDHLQSQPALWLHWPEDRLYFSAADRLRGDQLLAQLEDCLHDLLHGEQAAIHRLEQQQQETAAELARIRQAAAAHSAYQPQHDDPHTLHYDCQT
ncbi:MAG: hypothetical protein KatS3mg114_0377 [Planctomycetaceae bacterium]|nr:MAG: hypothetical protein KatS3mg114_0377 [Planctomycetaceae bacterium]